jgi:general secretion pathway protein A
MYKDFFGLNRNPFELSPDPSFMCTTEKSRAALASITYAIANRKGFVVMTGDAGTGKTLIVRSLFECWKSQGFAFANIFAPNLPLIDFLINATSDLGIKVTEYTKGNLLRAFHGFLVTQFQKGLTTVLVIDEAHQMPEAVLEEIRMLTNVETNQQKLVQVLLVGQPELDSKLDSFELRQLKQRIAIRCRLEPLTTEETNQYVICRLDLAGAKSQANAIFPAETIDLVHRYSGGIPRLINSVCEQALITACALQLRVVPAKIIEDVASLFRLDVAPDPKQTEKPLSVADEIQKSVPVETWQDLSSFKMPTMKSPGPDSSLRHLHARTGTPVQTQSPGNAETLYGRSLCDIPSIRHTQPEVSTPHNSTQTDYQGTNRATVPSKARALESAHASTKANESIFPEPTATAAKAGEPAIVRKLASVPILRGSRFLYAAVVVALATAVLLARHRNGEVIVPHEVARTWAASPIASTAPPIQPVETNSTVQFNDASAERAAVRRGNVIARSLEPEENSAPETRPAIDKLLRPVLKSPELSTVNEPPLIAETETNTVLDNGMFSISLPNPAPPAANTDDNLQPPKLVSSPLLASSLLERTGKMQGVVVIDALIDDTGIATDMKVISGFPRLTQVAMDALHTWKFEPARLNGRPIAMRTKVSVNFRLR